VGERRKKRGKREKGDVVWVPPPRGVHISKTDLQPVGWPNVKCFDSWMAKDIYPVLKFDGQNQT
jgi:hypothetical protein